MARGASIRVNGRPEPELAESGMIEVYERWGEAATYRIRYPVSVKGGDLPVLTDDRLSPGSEISIFAEAAGRTVCLAKGPVTGQQIHLCHGGSDSCVDVLGADASIAMDREDKTALWSDMTDSDAVSAIIARYGLEPDVETTSAGHPESKHALVQRESDLRFIRRLARRNGFLFWITSDPEGADTAHFRRPQVAGAAAAELVINLDAPNLEALDISWDVERPTSSAAKQLDLNSKATLDGGASTSPLPPMGGLALSAIAAGTRSLHLAAPADDAGDLLGRSEGALAEADFFIRATGRTTLDALGAIVRAHSVVTLRGAGSRHSGLYFSAGVRHTIDASSHRMELELVRNGWGI